VRLGFTLPTFTTDGSAAVKVACRAEAAGIDGVFVFDHLWPMGAPGRPALSAIPVLGAVAAATSTITIGPLVARVGLVDDDRLVGALATLAAVAGGPGRVIIGLGAGDRLSAAENLAYGLAFPPAGERLAAVASVADRLRRAGLTVWIGGTSAATTNVARAHADAHNVWGAVGKGDWTWGGQVLIGRNADDLARRRQRYGDRPGLVSGTTDQVAAALASLAGAGASWAVCAPLDMVDDPEAVVENLTVLGRALALA
jgi:alkanesulfonate monooxygenase SsuD/methylene tetrahydromethanopterin reductase-like flavin-dependent oxidoreductase (luciferase family)